VKQITFDVNHIYIGVLWSDRNFRIKF